MQFCGEKMKGNDAIALAAIEQFGTIPVYRRTTMRDLFQWMSFEMRDNRNIVLAAVKQDGN